MRIVFVSDFGEVNGGAAKASVTGARGLAEIGIPVTYVCGVGDISPMLDHPLIDVRRLAFDSVWDKRNPLAAAAQGMWNSRARTALEAILGDLPDGETIVHFHQWTKALSPSVLLAPLARRFPVVVSLHDYFLVCPNGAYYRYPQAAPCQLRPLSGACVAAQCDSRSYGHKLVRVARQWATRRALDQLDGSLHLVSVSPFAERAIERFLPGTNPRHVVRYGIDVTKTPPVDVASNRDFVYVGRLTAEKGVRLLAEIVRDGGFPLTIAGSGPLQAEITAIAPSIRCAGWLDAAGVDQVMRSARALIFPSTWYETQGMVVLEALARGIPVIVSRVTAAVDSVEDGVNGFTFDPTDRDRLANCMRMLQDDGAAARMGAEAYRRYWEAPPTPARHTEGLVAVYRSILGQVVDPQTKTLAHA